MFLLLFLALYLAQDESTVPRYLLSDLGPLPMIGNDALPGLSDDGAVCSWVNVNDTFVATHNHDGHGKSSVLPSLIGYSQMFANGINSKDCIVGVARSAEDRRESRAVYWKSGQIQPLDQDKKIISKAVAINESGIAVGRRVTPAKQVHATLWTISSVNRPRARDLGVLGTGQFSEATAVNALGHVVGASETVPGGKKQAFIWTGQGAIQPIGLLPGGSVSNAQAINDADDVVGWANSDGPELHAFLWQKGIMKDIGSLGDDLTVAFGVNNACQIVGVYAVNSQVTHAFLWQSGTMTDLNRVVIAPQGWVLREAYRINNRGQILCKGNYRGRAHLVLLTPR